MNVYVVEVKRLIKSFLIWTIVMTLLLSLFMAFFPSMAKSSMAELVRAKIDAIPPAMREAFNIDNMIDFSDLLQYFAYIAQFILMASCIYAAILGASALVKEESDGTIEFLYANPISRTKIVSMKLLSSFTILCLFNIIIFVVSVIFCEMFKEKGYSYLTMMVLIFKEMFTAELAFMAIGFALSTILPRLSQAVPTSLGIFFTTYLLGTFASIIKDLKWFKYVSPFHLVVPSDILKTHGEINIAYMSLLLAIILSGILLTYLKYRKKDL